MARRSTLILVVVVTCALLQFLDTVNSSTIAKRDANPSVASIIEEQIKAIPADRFVTDKVFIQQVDKTNKVTKYSIKGEDVAVYERNDLDTGKQVVVLTAEEDKLPFKKMKRVYVVFKNIEGNNYAASLAYIRDASPSDKGTVSIDGRNRVIEWGIFDEHVIHGRPVSNLMLLVCSGSMISNCLFNVSVLVPADKFIKSPPYKAKGSPKNVKEQVDQSVLISGDGSDTVGNYDAFADLEVNKFEGRGIGDLVSGVFSVGLVPSILSGASGILCVALAIVGICGHGRGSTELTVINESGIPLDPNMIQELVGRRKRATSSATDSGASDYPGWKTQYGNPTKGLILAKEEDTYFFGFGNCPYQKPNEELMKSSSDANVISYYRTVLRTECIPATATLISGFISEGILKLNSERNFEVVISHRYIAQPKLELAETIVLAGAIELSAFTTVFQDHFKRGKTPAFQMTPDGKRKMSKSTAFIGEVILTFLKLARQNARKHIMKLSRYMVLDLSSVFTKLAQDGQNLERCSECTEGVSVNLNDRIYIMAMSLFVKKGIGQEQESNIFKAFETFYKENEDKFENFVNVYS